MMRLFLSTASSLEKRRFVEGYVKVTVNVFDDTEPQELVAVTTILVVDLTPVTVTTPVFGLIVTVEIPPPILVDVTEKTKVLPLAWKFPAVLNVGEVLEANDPPTNAPVKVGRGQSAPPRSGIAKTCGKRIAGSAVQAKKSLGTEVE